MRIAQRVATIRQSISMTQEELGRRAGVSQGFIGHIESGIRNPSLGVLEKIATALGVSVGDLVDDPAPAVNE